ncbi:MAG: cupredoxin domain-containing protein [Nitrospinota bacterium]
MMGTRRRFLVAWLFTAFAILALGIWARPARAAEAAREVKLKAKEFAFDRAKPKVEPGRVTFVVTNVGVYPHGFAIEGMKAAIPRIDPGETARITVDLPKGAHVFYCPQRGHRERGMVGELAVGIAAKPAAKKKPARPRGGYYGY